MSEIQHRLPVQSLASNAPSVAGGVGSVASGMNNGPSGLASSIPAKSSSLLSSNSSTNSNTSTSSTNSANVSAASRSSFHPNAKTTTQISNGITTTKTNITSPVCRNCKTQTTPLWRRDETGQVLCNACGLFLKLHGRPRPISLKTDTIKSRNRIKSHASGPTTPSSPNTPELKSKDRKKSPKPKKKPVQTPTSVPAQSSLTPLLPASDHKLPPFHHHHVPHLSNHLLAHHIVQPLHYPSSTPTQFAPGLQRITSPLLLSTTSSISNAREATAAANAAGALENMSHELGPSATFKSTVKNVGGVSLMNNSKETNIKQEAPVYSTPSSALVQNNQNSAPQPPKLPALGSASSTRISSPSFGPQFHISTPTSNTTSASVSQPPHTSSSSTPNISQIHSPDHTHLPPIHHVSSDPGKSSIPHFQSSFNGYQLQQSQQGGFTNENSNSSGNNNSSNNSNNSNNNNNNNPNNNNSSQQPGGAAHEVTILKTRISELELVNDLYRTRIMELEAMEQAARLREQSMRKRLDEVMNLQPQTSQANTYSQSVHPIPGPQSSTPPMRAYGNVLPSIRNVSSPHGNFAIPPMKREADDDSKDDVKKRAI